MYICPVCNHTSETPTNFCSLCGSAMIEKAPEPVYTAPSAPEAPAYSAPQPTYTEPTTYAAPGQPYAPGQPQQTYYNQQPQQTYYNQQPYAPGQPFSYNYTAPQQQTPSLGKTIAGMVISIVGMVLGIIFLQSIVDTADYDPVSALGMAVILCGIQFALSMVGFKLSSSAREEGSTSPMTNVGKIVGLIGWISALAIIGISFIISIAE